jgi:H+-transporting ATPase
MGIAVSTATDVAKSAAGIVLTKPGLEGCCGRSKRRPDNVPAHPDLYLELRYKEDCAGALPGGGSDHNRTRDPDPNVDGHYHDHRRLPRHVLDDGQRATVPDAKCMASWQLDDRGRFHGHLRAGVLHRRTGHRQIPLGLGMETLRTLAFLVIVFGNQATMYTNRTRQRLWSTRPSSWLVLSSVVDLLIASTMANRPHGGHRHGASAITCDGSGTHVAGAAVSLHSGGHCQSPRIHAAVKPPRRAKGCISCKTTRTSQP